MHIYSNPVKRLIVDDWPIGGTNRGSAIFTVESDPKKGERISRVTDDKNRKFGKPKLTTYDPLTRIMTGDDGRTYIVSLTAYGFIKVMQGNLKYQEESIFDTDDRFSELRQLLIDSK